MSKKIKAVNQLVITGLTDNEFIEVKRYIKELRTKHKQPIIKEVIKWRSDPEPVYGEHF